MSISTTVSKRLPAQFDQVGQFLGYPLQATAESISPGLANRIARYAVQRMTDSGFEPFLATAEVNVYTMDGDEESARRSYCVKFTSPKGGSIEVVGILTVKGWPSLDHGFEINGG